MAGPRITVESVRGRLENTTCNMEELANYYGLSVEDFTAVINKHSRNYSFVYDMLKQNEKKRKKLEKKEGKQAEDFQPEEDIENGNAIPTDGSATYTSDATAESKSTITTEEIPQDLPIEVPVVAIEVEEIDPYDAEISRITDEINRQKSDYEEKLKEKNKLLNEKASRESSIQQREKELSKIEAQKTMVQKGLATDKEYLNKYIAKLSEIESELTAIQNSIDSANEDIITLKRITVEIGENGEISCDRKITIPTTWSDVYQKLSSNALIEDVTVKQLRQVAKLIVLHHSLEDAGEDFNFIFKGSLVDGGSNIKSLYELFLHEEL